MAPRAFLSEIFLPVWFCGVQLGGSTLSEALMIVLRIPSRYVAHPFRLSPNRTVPRVAPPASSVASLNLPDARAYNERAKSLPCGLYHPVRLFSLNTALR